MKAVVYTFGELDGTEPHDENVRRENRGLLADGVRGIECTFAGRARPYLTIHYPAVLELIGFWNLGDIEVYANKEMNVYFRSESEKSPDRVIGFIRVSPKLD